MHKRFILRFLVWLVLGALAVVAGGCGTTPFDAAVERLSGPAVDGDQIRLTLAEYAHLSTGAKSPGVYFQLRIDGGDPLRLPPAGHNWPDQGAPDWSDVFTVPADKPQAVLELTMWTTNAGQAVYLAGETLAFPADHANITHTVRGEQASFKYSVVTEPG